MNTSTKKHAKNTLLSSVLFLPALAVALWAGRLEGIPCFLAVLGAIGLALSAFCFLRRKDDLVHDFFLPILLFAALGGMTWAVRGSSGFGSVKGCVFAGVMWGAAWWFIARNPGGPPARRYASGWIVLALTIGIGLSGGRGWMQWSSFFDGMLQTNTSKNEWVEISPTYGLIWLFIAGMPWAGIGACLLAWCATEKPLAAWQWSVRLFCGFGAAFFAAWLYKTYPQWFLPLYTTMSDRYADLEANPNLKRLMNDNGSAVRHMGFFLGFLLYELGRRDWKNVTLISTVGILNGFGWALCQNWKWADNVWPDAQFNFWRAWESSGGISIGIAYGVAYYLVNRRTAPCACAPAATRTGFPIFGVLSMVFMSVTLIWYCTVNASALFSAEWTVHLPFCAVLIYGLVLYFWHLRSGLLGAENAPSAIPKLGPWAVRFGFMLLVAWFMMGMLEFRGASDASAPLWARYDYLFLGVTAVYGLLYFLSALWKTATTRPSEEASIVPFFQRYPNLDWLVVYLSLTIIACSYFRGELPAWKGWFWLEQENPIFWTSYLGLACLAALGVVWCALSYLSPRKDGAGIDSFAVHLGLLLGLGMSLKNGTRGWANIYLGDEDLWGQVYWRYIGPGMLIVLVAVILLAIAQRVLSRAEGNRVPHAFALIVLVLIHQNIIAHFITGPPTNWSEVVFNIYYVLLSLITATIFYHYHFMQSWAPFLVGEVEGEDSSDDIATTGPSAMVADTQEITGAAVRAAGEAEGPADEAEEDSAPETSPIEDTSETGPEVAPAEEVLEATQEVTDAVEVSVGETPSEIDSEGTTPSVEAVEEDSADLDSKPMFEDDVSPAETVGLDDSTGKDVDREYGEVEINENEEPRDSEPRA